MYFIEFMLYSFLGWVYECVFCMVKERHWENRGFLFGPVCPIYGAGMIFTIIIIGKRPLSRLFFCIAYGTPLAELPAPMPYWLTFIICAVCATLAEYVTSVYLENKFHARWWDYSDMPLNFNGRICIPAAIAFGLLGVAGQHFVVPFSQHMHDTLPDSAGSLLALILMALFTADIVLTVENLKHITEKLVRIEDRLNKQLQAAYESVEGAPASVKAAMRTRIFERLREHIPEVTKEELMTIRRANRLSVKSAGSAAVKHVVRLFTVSFVFIKKGGGFIVQKTKRAGKKLTAPLRTDNSGNLQTEAPLEENGKDIRVQADEASAESNADDHMHTESDRGRK